jgi:hypothetical protein
MAKVIHKRGDRRYIYEHKRINGKVVSKYIAPVDNHDETSVLRERIAELEDALQCKTIREARKNAGVVQEVAQHQSSTPKKQAITTHRLKRDLRSVIQTVHLCDLSWQGDAQTRLTTLPHFNFNAHSMMILPLPL